MELYLRLSVTLQVMADAPGGGVLVTTPMGLYEASPGGDGSFSWRSHPLPAQLADKPLHGIRSEGCALDSRARSWQSFRL